jgi:hypothetical protein
VAKARVANAAQSTTRATSRPTRLATRPQSSFCIAAERPASTAQLTGLSLETLRIQAGTRLCCMSAEDRKVSGRRTRLTAPITDVQELAKARRRPPFLHLLALRP